MVLVNPTNICLVIPVYNEEKSISWTMQKLLESNLGVNILFVNDGSSDLSSDIITHSGIPHGMQLLEMKRNEGYGKACWLGAKEALNRGFSWVIFADSDLTNSPQEISRLIKSIDDDFDIIKTNRFSDVYGMREVDRRRVIYSKVAQKITKVCFGKFGEDGTNGFRAIKLDFFSTFNPKEGNFSAILEELYFALVNKARILYIPTSLKKRGLHQKETSFNYSLKLISDYLKYCLLAAFHRFSRFSFA